MMLELNEQRGCIVVTNGLTSQQWEQGYPIRKDEEVNYLLPLSYENDKICSSDIKTVFLLLDDMLRANDLDTTKLQQAMKELTGITV